MANVFIIYGSEGSPNENWIPWLKNELEKIGHKVFVPTFPTPENQTLTEWMKVWSEYAPFLNEDSIVIGHSLGVLFLLNVLEKSKVKGAFFVAGFGKLPGNRFDEGMRSFAKDFDFAKIKANCENFVIYHGDNDPYVKLEVQQDLADKLGVNIQLVKDAGHFNTAAGYDKFELLLENIQQLN